MSTSFDQIIHRGEGITFTTPVMYDSDGNPRDLSSASLTYWAGTPGTHIWVKVEVGITGNADGTAEITLTENQLLALPRGNQTYIQELWDDTEVIGRGRLTALDSVRYAAFDSSAEIALLQASASSEGLDVDFSASGGTSYSWDFGDTNTGTGATPSHTYAAAGTYFWSVEIDGDPVRTINGSVTVSAGVASPVIDQWDLDLVSLPALEYDPSSTGITEVQMLAGISVASNKLIINVDDMITAGASGAFEGLMWLGEESGPTLGLMLRTLAENGASMASESALVAFRVYHLPGAGLTPTIPTGGTTEFFQAGVKADASGAVQWQYSQKYFGTLISTNVASLTHTEWAGGIVRHRASTPMGWGRSSSYPAINRGSVLGDQRGNNDELDNAARLRCAIYVNRGAGQLGPTMSIGTLLTDPTAPRV